MEIVFKNRVSIKRRNRETRICGYRFNKGHSGVKHGEEETKEYLKFLKVMRMSLKNGKTMFNKSRGMLNLNIIDAN